MQSNDLNEFEKTIINIFNDLVDKYFSDKFVKIDFFSNTFNFQMFNNFCAQFEKYLFNEYRYTVNDFLNIPIGILGMEGFSQVNFIFTFIDTFC